MKFFTKTLLFFIWLIILEAILTLTLITKIISNNNYEDSRVELQNEISLIYDSHNSWKRKLWISLIEIKNNKRIYNLSITNNDFSKRRLIYLLRSNFIRSGIDYIMIKNRSTTYTINLTKSEAPEKEIKTLNIYKSHPYLEMRKLGSSLYMIGNVRIGKDDETYDIFLIKNIDLVYCKHLTINRPSEVVFFTKNSEILTPQNLGFNEFLKNLNLNSSYMEIYNREINRNYFNIGIQQLEPILPQGKTLFMAVILSNEPYIRRITSIRNTAFFVTLFVSILSIFISFFISKNITNPIKVLSDAMKKMKYGNKPLIPDFKIKNEIQELFTGFNEMALRLAEDKRIMENYINEIKLLNDLNEKIFNSLHAGMVILDKENKIIKANKYFCETFQKENSKIINRRIDELKLSVIDNEIIDDIKEILSGNKNFKSRIRRYKENKIFEIKLYPLFITDSKSLNPTGCILVTEDISKKIEFEEKIFQAEKLSSLSLLTAGVAHEINNPLSSIMSNVQNLIDEENNKDRIISLKWIEQETRRIAKIIHELLTFSSSSPESAPSMDLNQTILQVTQLIQYSISKNKNIKIIHEFGENIPPVRIDEDEMKQVIINIINNSIHAIEKDGIITISTFYDESKNSVSITISDTGSGIPEEIIQKIFDPFFTTKKNGMGTGLGLSIVYGIIKKYGGNITIKSKINRGTSIELDIPIVSE